MATANIRSSPSFHMERFPTKTSPQKTGHIGKLPICVENGLLLNSDSPSSKHYGTLEKISKLFETLESQRLKSEEELGKVFNQRATIHNELHEVDRSIYELQQKKFDLQNQMERLETIENELRGAVDDLEKKITSIGEESEKFESNIKQIKGTILTEADGEVENTTTYTTENPKTDKTEKTVFGHRKAILDVDFDEQNEILVSCGAEKTIRVFDMSEGLSHQSTLRGHVGWIRAIQISSDRFVASGSGDSTIKLWRVLPTFLGRNPTCLATLTGHKSGISCLQFNSTRLVSGSTDRTCKIYDLDKRVEIQNLVGHSKYISDLQFYEHGIATSSGDKTVKCWDSRDGLCYRSLKGHTDAVTSLQFDDVRIITGSMDNTVKVFDLRTGECLHSIFASKKVNCVKFNKKNICVATDDNIIQVYNVNNFEEETFLSGHSGIIRNLSLKNNTLVSCSEDKTVKVWELL